MTHSQSLSQSADPFEAGIDEAMHGIRSSLDQALDQGAREHGPRGIGGTAAVGTRPPVGPKAGGGGELWGPSHQRATSPSQIQSPVLLLAEVASHCVQLHEQMLQLVTMITGEQAPSPRLRTAPLRSTGLLPNIAAIAHEIEEANLMTARLVAHVRGRL